MKRRNKKKITVVMTTWLVLIVLAVCTVSALLTYVTLHKRYEKLALKMERHAVEDVSVEMNEMVDEELIATAEDLIQHAIPSSDPDDPQKTSRLLLDYYNRYGIEVNVVNREGVITYSSNPEYVGYNMREGEQSAAFLILLDGSTDTFVQDLSRISFDGSHLMKYGGMRFPDGSGFLQVGFTQTEYYNSIDGQAMYVATNRRIGESGYILICNKDFKIVNSYHNEHTGDSIEKTNIELDPSEIYDFRTEEMSVFSIPSYVVINNVRGYYVIGVFPISEAEESTHISILVSILLEFAVFAVLFAALVLLIQKRIVKNLIKITDSLTAITKGNLEEKVEVRDTFEFNVLSDDINTTVDKLKEYIAEEAARIDIELSAAKTIQSSALPSVFPAFPDRHDFELYALMRAAKEVGGDFYDFGMLDDDTLGFVIADVSGKSIPGAMFMMTAKTVLKNLAESGLSPAEVFTRANEKLCEGNEAEMFVTAWLGCLDLKTGLVRIANAGHNPPVLIRNGKAEYVKCRPDLMLAVMEGLRYTEHTLQLQKGDILYLYTDGVTEAMDADLNLYGGDNLKELLSFGDDTPAPSAENGISETVCNIVLDDVVKFSAGAEQSDDITMLCIQYLGQE